MQSFDGESLELLRHGFRKYLLFVLHCPHCRADFRCGDVSLLSDRYPCPKCSSECQFEVIGRGVTRRDLPFVEHAAAGGSLPDVLDFGSKEEPRAESRPRPKRAAPDRREYMRQYYATKKAARAAAQLPA